MHLTDLPEALDPAVYEETRRVVAQKYGAIPTVKALVEFGTIPFPGISDMDSYVIAEPGAHVPCPPFSAYTQQQQYALMHKHFAISDAVYPKLHYCDPWLIHTDVVVGDAQKYAMPASPFSEEERIDMSLHFAITHGLVSFLPMLAHGCIEGELEVREFLESNKYVEYHYREFRRAKAVPEDSTDASIPTYQNLRKQWFTFSPEEQQSKTDEAFAAWKISMRKLLSIASDHLVKIMTTMPTPQDIAARSSHPLLRDFPRSFVLDLGSAAYVYQEGRSEILMRTETISIFGRSHTRTIFVLPLPLASIINIHLLGAGPMTDYFRAHASSDLPVLPVHDKPVLRRLLDIIRTNVEDTRHMENVKQPFVLYGFSLAEHAPNWKVRLGRLEGKCVELLRKTPLRGALEERKECVL